MLELLILVIVVALVFDFINGFHDAANAIATTVATGAMGLGPAVVVSGVFNFIGALGGTAVAGFIASKLAAPADVTSTVLLAALLGASVWNIITWWYGIPSSSSHALIGGLAGAVTAHAGWDHFEWGNLTHKVLIPLVLSPLLGFLAALAMMVVMFWLLRRKRLSAVNRTTKHLQLFSACTLSYAHGSNDAQKVMGIITLALVAYATANQAGLPQWIQDNHSWFLSPGQEKGKWMVPTWVIYACAAAISLGTMAGGRRIIKTMGAKIVRMDPPQGFSAQTAGTGVILAASALGVPVSTTHCISASILGAGASRGLGKVRWGVAINIVIAWVLTIPISAGIAWLCLLGLRAAGLKD
ncbi:MAG: inorganic phosphate transporter [Planctomycetes bacterium]|nr:inorganic phosphate transporter [Planctomycetota bacterium]